MSLQNVESLKPTGLFTNYIYKAIPLVFDESMSYYETLLGLLAYLKNTVIPTVNNNADAVAELQNLYTELHDYVENYFNNLDVQQEINNKLDNLVTDGTLEQLIGKYINPYFTQFNNRLEAQDEKIASSVSGSPAGVYNTFTDLQQANPDHSKIYVVTTDGNWYFWDTQTSQWKSGGVYQATQIADNTIGYNQLTSNIQKNLFEKSINSLNLKDMEKTTKNGISVSIKNNTVYINGTANAYTTFTIAENLSFNNSSISISSQLIQGTANFINGGKTDLLAEDKSTILRINLPTTKLIEGSYVNNNNSTGTKLRLVFSEGDIINNAQYRLSLFENNTGIYGRIAYTPPIGIIKLNDDVMPNSYNPTISTAFNNVYEDIELTIQSSNHYYNYPDNLETFTNYLATSLDVKAGEQYHYEGIISGIVEAVLFSDENNNIIKQIPTFNHTLSQNTTINEDFIIPEGCTKIYLNGLNNIILKKVIGVELKNEDISSDYYIKQLQDFNINEQLKNDFKWSDSINTSKCATFTFDDSNTDIDLIEDLFEKKGVPCCFATIPKKLNDICTNGETVKQVLQRAVANGGEILSHWSPHLNSLSTLEDYINVYINSKKTLTENGFEVYGIITAGGGTDGTPQSYKTQNFDLCTKIARNNYFYGDQTSFNKPNIEQYFNKRKFLDNGYENVKTYIDDFLKGIKGDFSKWLNFASHGTISTSIDIIEQIIDYCLAQNIEIVTWKTVYDRYRSSNLEEQIKLLKTQT